MQRPDSNSPVSLVTVILLGTALAVVAIPTARAQNSAAPGSGGVESVIRSETRVVLVDAVAVDRQNKFARDLTQKDFRVLEDGKEQKITSFSLESAGVSPDRSSKHFIVLFFDTATLTPSTLLTVRQDAFSFVDSFASPDRYMAVIAWGGDMQVLQNFTPDATRIKDALARVRNSPLAAPAPNAGGRGGRGGAANPASMEPYRLMLASLRTVAGSLSAIRGRKALVLFSGGINAPGDLSADITATSDACNRANVAVYGVNGRGLIGELGLPGAGKPGRILAGFGRELQRIAGAVVPSAGDPAGGGAVFGFQRRGGGGNSPIMDASGSPMNSSPSGVAASMDVVRALASGTGGLMLGSSNNLPQELGRIAQEQDEYYLLGYTPAIESAEGTCHTLQVKVDRRGLDVRARKGYCTSKPPDPLMAKAAGQDLEGRAAGSSAGNIAVKMQLPWFYAGPNVAQVSLAMDFVPATMTLRKDQGKLHGEFDLAGVAYKPDGSIAAHLSDTVKVDFDNQQQAEAFVKASYHYANQFEIAPGHYDFRIGVSSGDHGFGKADLPLAIEPWNGQTLSVSGLALSRDAHAAAARDAGLDGLLPERARPLVSNGLEVVPTGTSQFRTGEKGFFYFEVYESPLSARRISVRVRILDRATDKQIDDSGPMNADRFVRPGNPVIPIAMTLPIAAAGLPAGAYKLEVSVSDGAAQDGVQRTADFDVF